MSNVYLNGQFMPLEEARVPVMDRGFIFGDGVYEVIPVYAHQPLGLERHLARLDRTCAGVRIKNPYTLLEWRDLLSRLIANEPAKDQSLYIHITRGVAPRDHAFPANVSPTVFAMAKPMPPVPAAWLTQGVKAITHADFRWLKCDLKTTALLANILLRQLAVDAGATECLLLRDGFLTELRRASEVMMTSSTREIVPITLLDHVAVGCGQPGPVFKHLLALYQELKPS